MKFRKTNTLKLNQQSFGGLFSQLKDKSRRQKRQMLSETLEQRQLLAGPELIGIETNNGELIQQTGSNFLTVAPRELVFRFDEQSDLDPATIANGIRITRSGGGAQSIESATAISDLNPSGVLTASPVQLEFRASTSQPGALGSGIRVQVTSSDRGTTSQSPLVNVNTASRVVQIELNSNPNRTSTVRDLITAVQANALASNLIEVIQISGSSLSPIGNTVTSQVDLVLGGAGAAQFISDLGTGTRVSARFVSKLAGQSGVGTLISVSSIPSASANQQNRVTVFGSNINVALRAGSTAADLIRAINTDSTASGLVFAQLELGNGTTTLSNPNFSFSLELTNSSEILVEPGFIGLGDTNHEVVFRFANGLPQDQYQIDVFGTGVSPLRNVIGEPVTEVARRFSIDTAPQIAAVVPTPITRQSNGALSPAVNVIEVYFSNDDYDLATIQTPANYQLIYTNDTVNNTDDRIVVPNAFGSGPSNSTYDSVNRVARLVFTDPLSRMRDPLNPTQFLKGAARLRVGSNQTTVPAVPSNVAVSADSGDSFSQATSIGSLSTSPGQTQTLLLTGAEIRNPVDYELTFPGGADVPGVRAIRPEDPTRIIGRTVPLDVVRNADGDDVSGISTIYYDFPGTFFGDDPNQGGLDLKKEYINIATDEHKKRVREVLSLYSEYLGVQFIETSGGANGQIQDPGVGKHISIAVGDIYATTYTDSVAPVISNNGGVTVATRPLNNLGLTFISATPVVTNNGLLVMDFQDFDESVDDQLGGEFFRGAFLGVGQLLGYGYSDHLPQPVTQSTQSVLSPGDSNEPLFPSPSDIATGQFLYKPENNDIDLFRFQINSAGKLKIQTIAERLETSSSLDSSLRLYRETSPFSNRWEEISANDDYFSSDSLIEIDGLASGAYMIGVSASGNNVYDPSIPGSGIGGRTQGRYDVRIEFEAKSNASSGIKDRSGLSLDGDLDGKAGGEFNYWFQPFAVGEIVFVDRAFTGPVSGFLGSTTNPYREIDLAIADVRRQIAATPSAISRQIRIVGGGEYQLGLDGFGAPLRDGADIDLPKGTQLTIDAGSTFLMQGNRIGVGSTTEGADKSQTSIQILGTPGNEVVFRSNRSVPSPGDWGGIDLRSDIDNAANRVNPEELGLFLNHIQFAHIRDGGGVVRVDSQPTVVSPIEMALTRATIINNRITNSADAAIAATPDTFAETSFDEFRFQRDGAFTADYGRVGPDIHGNEIIDNSINGLFIRLQTRAGEDLETLNVTARFDDTEIVHVLTENLLIEGNPGGPDASTRVPSLLQTRAKFIELPGNVPTGNYDYVVTFINRDGYETAPSERISVNVPEIGSVEVTGLPVISLALRDLGYTGRRVYRAPSGTNDFVEVARLNSSATGFVDVRATGTARVFPNVAIVARLDPGLRLDAGTILKLTGARIDVTLGAHFYAEGSEASPIVMTSLNDNRYGASGTFDTNIATNQNSQTDGSPNPSDWGGVYVGFGADASFDHVTLAGGGGATRVEGGFGSFNVIEAHQGGLRVANSRFENNGDGRNFVNNPTDVRTGRVGRGDNASGTIFVRGSQPVIIDSEFIDGKGPVMSFDVNSFTFTEVTDAGRSTGSLDAFVFNGNSGPLIQGNSIGTTRPNQTDPSNASNVDYSCSDSLGQNPLTDLDGNIIACSLNGLEIRGGTVSTEVVLDDTDIVHIVRDTIEIPNQTIYGGLRIESDARGSLVIKFQNQDTANIDSLQRRQAGIVAGGNLISAEDQFVDIADRIGGSLQVVGHPDFPVVLTTLRDDTVGAGFTPSGRQNVDSDNNSFDADPVFIPIQDTGGGEIPPPLLPLSPEYDRTDVANIDNGTTIDNDVDPAVFGFFAATIGAGGEVLNTVDVTHVQPATATAPEAIIQIANLQFLYTTFIDVDVRSPLVNPAPVRLSNLEVTTPPVLIGPDRVRSEGRFFLKAGDINPNTPNNPERRPVIWRAESFFVNNRATLYTTLSFETEDGGGFADDVVSSVQVTSYVDQGIVNDQDDVLYQKGAPGQSDFRAITVNRISNINRTPLIGFAHGGIYTNDLLNQDNATYQGWAASNAPNLLNLITTEQVRTSVTGVIDPNLTVQSAEPPIENQTAGTSARGVDDIGTSFTWQLNGGSDNAKVTTLVEFLPSDPSNPRVPDLPPSVAGSGTWDGITIREAASDSNVYITAESEPANLGNPATNDTNNIPSEAQFLGELAPSVTEGDNQRRLGFIVEGTISTRGDLDVYSFVAEAGTQVWLDIDRTNSRLDTVVELIDANGNIRALSDNSLTEAIGTTSRLNGSGFDASTARSLNSKIVPASSPTSDFQDLYSTNPKDAGMRVVLPGNVGQRSQYFIRVRSNNSASPSASSLTAPGQVLNGLTSGAYQLQIRLQEGDVFAGTQLRHSDVRFAANGVQILGGPNHSPITGDEYESRGNNDSIQNSQRLGLYETQFDTLGQLFFDRNVDAVPNSIPKSNLLLENPAGPLSSDRLAKTVAGFIDGASDVDWYQFDVGYKNLTRDDAALFLSTVFDVDYSDGLARPDTAIYVFNEAGQLILVGKDSNIADDQSRLNDDGSVDFSDLSRGSFGGSDPFIGSAELPEGTYFLAISNQTLVPSQLDQFTNPNSGNPLLRLEPLDSIERLVEDRISRTPITVDPANPIPTPELLFDFSETGDSIVDFTLDDVLLYVNTGSSLFLVNPYTGVNYGQVGGFGGETLEDIAFRNNGELFAYNDTTSLARNDASLLYYRIDTGSGALSAPLSTGANLSTFEATQTIDPMTGIITFTSVPANTGFEVEALTIASLGGNELGYFVGRRAQLSGVALAAGADYSTNVLYGFVPNTGVATGPLVNFNGFLSGAATQPQEVGQIFTDVQALNPSFGQLLTQLGISAANRVDATGTVVPAILDGNRFTISDFSDPVTRNSVTYEFDLGPNIVAQAGVAIPDGQTLTVDGQVFEFNTGQRLLVASPPPTSPNILVGSTVRISVPASTPSTGPTDITFEFVRTGSAQSGRTAISIADNNGQLLTAAALSQSLVNSINVLFPNARARALGDVIAFTGNVAPTVITTGPAVTLIGTPGFNSPSAIPVDISDTVNPTVIIARLESAATRANLPTIVAGTQITFPTATSVTLSALSGSAAISGLQVNGTVGVSTDSVPILVRPGDSARVIADRIVQAIDASSGSGNLIDTSAFISGVDGNSLRLTNAEVTAINGVLVDSVSPASQRFSAIRAGGVRLGGTVTGTEIVNGQNLFAVTNQGELYSVGAGTLSSTGARQIGSLVASATDLIGIPFTGLRSGPSSYNDGELRQILFGITASGDVHAFNTAGELQPIFAGGRSMISTGIPDARGLDFSTVAYNLWHTTLARGGDLGHGIDPLFNSARPANSGTESLAFNYETNAFFGNYSSGAEFPSQIDVNGNVANPRQDGTTVERSFNIPGGAKGIVQSSEFSLEGFDGADLPALYFSYFLANDGADSLTNDRDSLKVYLIDSEGTQHLVATNNLATGSLTNDDEFDLPANVTPYDQGIDVDVQPLFDNTGTWRQARISLSPFAGHSNLSLRIEFATAGSTALTRTLQFRTVAGSQLSSGNTFVIGGETFSIDLASTLSVPTGAQLASLYTNPASQAVITIDGQQYVLNDGTRTIGPSQLSVLVTSPGTALANLSAASIAQSLKSAIEQTPPQTFVGGVAVADPQDTVPSTGTARNDTTNNAISLPYNGGRVTFQALGQLGNDLLLGQINDVNSGNITNLDDVDLLRVNVVAGTTVDVGVVGATGQAILATVRFFDDLGAPLIADLTTDTNPNNARYTAPKSGSVFIGISGRGNTDYNPVTGTGKIVGQGVGRYDATVSIKTPLDIRIDGNLLELGGLSSVAAAPASLFSVVRSETPIGIPVRVSRFSSANEVASVVRQAIADTFYRGDVQLIPAEGANIRLPLLSLEDSGPFANLGQRFGDSASNVFATGQLGGTLNNAFEGVYLDDFIIGFAERGEVVTGSVGLNATGGVDFVSATTLENPSPAVTVTDSGPYQIEIRDGSEYIASGLVQTTSGVIPLQTFQGDIIVVPINGTLYGIRNAGTAIPAGAIVGRAQVNGFPALSLPTLNLQALNVLRRTAAGLPALLQTPSVIDIDSLGIDLIELDSQLQPINRDSTINPIDNLRYFQRFNTNDRLTDGIVLSAIPGFALLDGAQFEIADSQGQLTFEFDVNGERTNPFAVLVPFLPGDSASQVAQSVITAILAPAVQSVLNVGASPSGDGNIDLVGDVSVREIGDAFAGTVLAGNHRGDSNRDRLQQGTIIVEDSRFLLGSTSGVEVSRAAVARVLSQDQRDEFPIALTYPQNLIELNSEALIPGVVVQNNVIAFNGNNGILVTGIDGGGSARVTPVGFDQIVNNTLVGGVIQLGVDTGAQIFGDQLFSRGGISFADELRDFRPGQDVDSEFSDDTNGAALSSPDCFGPGHEPATGQFSLSLGTNGTATFVFTDNLLIGDGSPAPDLVIFETGVAESVRVEISRDNVNFIDVGTANSLNPEIDIDQFGVRSGDRFAYVRLTDLNLFTDGVTEPFGAAGADIDAIGALSTVPAFEFTPGSQGIVVRDNAGPTLLNNIVSNFQTGVAFDGLATPTPLNTDVSRLRTVVGGTTYYRNGFNATDPLNLGLFPQVPDPLQEIFVNPTRLLFAPQESAVTIDSSIDSLEDRAALVTVREAVGLSPIPILAPVLDLSGQLRVDDPSVNNPTGLGERVFKDRGAEERADKFAPRVLLITPRAEDRFAGAGTSTIPVGTISDAFEFQLVDGISTITTIGVGVDDGSVSGAVIRLTRQRSMEQFATTLVEGTDYRFAYEPGDNTVRLTPIAGIWEAQAIYEIVLIGGETGIIQANQSKFNFATDAFDPSAALRRLPSGTTYADGALTQVVVSPTETRLLEVESGINITIVPEFLVTDDAVGSQIPNIAGQSLVVFDGLLAEPVVFELVTTNNTAVINAIRASGREPVRVGDRATGKQVAEALALAITGSALSLSARAVDNRIQLLGDSSVVSPAIRFSYAEAGTPAIGKSAFKLTNFSLDVILTQNAIQVDATQINGFRSIDAAAVTIFDGTIERTFEFDNNGAVAVVPDPNLPPPATVAANPGATIVPVPVDTTPREMINALLEAIRRTTDLDVNVVAASDRLRITGSKPISVTSSNLSVSVKGLGSIGVSPGYGLRIPNDGLDLSTAVVDGQFFTSVNLVTGDFLQFELDSDGTRVVENSILVSIADRTVAATATAIVAALQSVGIQAQNVGGGFVTVSGNERLNFVNSALESSGLPGSPAPARVVIPLDADVRQVAAAYDSAIANIGVQHTLNGDRVLIDGVRVTGTSVVQTRVSDEAGNVISGLGSKLTIFVGGGFDYGDAPSPYVSIPGQGGPSHVVDVNFTLGATVTDDIVAKLPNADSDDGVVLPGSLRPGFLSSLSIEINNPENRTFYVDAWFDWNGNKVFDTNEVIRYGSAGTGRITLANGTNVVAVNVPSTAVIGETYARFRLSEVANLGSGGDAFSGEVEDYSLIVTNNPFTNPVRAGDVNNSGATTPLDALQIINVLNRYQSVDPGARSINLSEPLPPGFVLPVFPDVNGDGQISASDALEVIRILNQASTNSGSGEGESLGTNFVRTSSGILVSQATLIGDTLISGTSSLREPVEQEPEVPSQTVPNKLVAQPSVFDPQAIIALDSLVDLIAEDNVSARSTSGAEKSELSPLDAVFANL